MATPKRKSPPAPPRSPNRSAPILPCGAQSAERGRGTTRVSAASECWRGPTELSYPARAAQSSLLFLLFHTANRPLEYELQQCRVASARHRVVRPVPVDLQTHDLPHRFRSPALPSHNRNRARKIQSDVDGETPVCLARVHAICSTVAPQGEIDPAEVTGSADTRAGHSHGFTTPLPPRFARSPSPVPLRSTGEDKRLA